jgi:3-hydroxy acid dehydrogenase / malonic semialdehyde reductase
MPSIRSCRLAATSVSKLFSPEALRTLSPRGALGKAIVPILSSQSPIFSRAMSSAMAKRLEGKTVLITGASSGIGQSIAKEFAQTAPKSLKIILTARRLEKLKELAAEINKEVGDGVKVLPVQLDIRMPEEVKNFSGNLPDEFKDIDILVNNAGLVKGVAKAPDILPEDIDVMFSTNVTGLINMTQAILPIMLKRGESGTGDIINIGSIAGREGYPGGSIYCTTKAAVRTFTDALRRELISSRIRVIEVDPGQVETVSQKRPRQLLAPQDGLCSNHRNFQSSVSAATKKEQTQSTQAVSP